MKNAIITGVTGQDGSILAEMLTQRGYKVFGLVRRNSQHGFGCLDTSLPGLEIVEGDLTDLSSLTRLCSTAQADIFINCAAQSHVGTSFTEPHHTFSVTAGGVLNCLEAMRLSRRPCRFLQLSSSEMFGGMDYAQTYDDGFDYLTEESPFNPRSPYAVAKVAAYYLVRNYREAYGLHASNSIAFNHEEPGRRGPNFVTRKITLGIAGICNGTHSKLSLGNIDAKRDWGLASDYCDGMIRIVEAPEPGDYILATGQTHSVREFLEIAFDHAGLGDWQQYIEIDPALYRPSEVQALRGDYQKIRDELGWSPSCSFDSLVRRMVDYDLSGIGIDPLEGTVEDGLFIIGKEQK